MIKLIEESGEEGNKDYSDIIKKFEELLNASSGNSSLIDILLAEDCYEDDKNLFGKKTSSIVENIEENIPDIISKEIKERSLPKVEIQENKIVQEKKVELTKENVVPISPKKPTAIKKETGKAMDVVDKNTQKTTIADSVVRVNVKLLDKIMNVVGELVLNRNQILQFANNDNSSDLTRLAQQLNVITTELQTDIMTTRMQPVGSVLNKFERIVRDLARSQKKKIRLTISGKDTELDKTLLEAIRDPMTHLIRNSVDHGIENPEKREELGKGTEGNIYIKAYHEGGQVTIEIRDDGNGINPEKILEKAISKGLVNQEKAATLSRKQILNLIFLPGFSTAEQVTNISGRGVGMDVVKSNIEKIGGSVDIDSVMGEGSAFKLKIPLTLAIVPALVIQSSQDTFAIPQINLVELVRLEGEDCISKIERLHNSEFFRLRGELIPVFRLKESLGLDDNLAKDKEDINEEESTNIVILNAEGRVYGLIVDTVLDTEEIVVKPLSRKLKDLTIYGGATIMGDGRVALIVDALGFFNHVDKGNSQKVEKIVVDDVSGKLDLEADEVLLCDLGDGRQYGIPLCLVSRLEELDLKKVEWSGNQPLIRYGDGPMPLLNLEKTMHLDGQSALIDNKKDGALPCVVVSIRGALFGLVVSEIRDIALSDGKININTVDRDGILGTTFVNESTISLIDAHKIVDLQNIGVAQKENRGQKSKGHILLVEDSPLYQKVQKEYLVDEGFEVTVAEDGEVALRLLNAKSESYDLVLTDIEMPNCSGWELVETVRSLESKFSKIPVIALSSNIRTKDFDEGQRMGFNYMIEKMNQAAVNDAIDAVLCG